MRRLFPQARSIANSAEFEQCPQLATLERCVEPMPQGIDGVSGCSALECAALSRQPDSVQSSGPFSKKLSPIDKVIMQQRLADLRLGGDCRHAYLMNASSNYTAHAGINDARSRVLRFGALRAVRQDFSRAY